MAPAKDFDSSLPPPPSTPTLSASFDASVHAEESPCPFCKISETYAHYDPQSPPAGVAPPALDPEATSPSPSTFIVLSTPLLIAFLDILPLSHGHVLLCPRRHAPKLTSATNAEAAAMGLYLRLLSAALVEVTGVKDWNVVQNNGAAAAQVVPHMHFHIIPRPDLTGRRERFTSTMFGRGQREELDEEEGAALAQKIRAAIGKILREEEKKRDSSEKAKL